MKIRGCRIELEEIEHVLDGAPGSPIAAVAMARDSMGGETQLIAYIVAATGERPEANELRDFLKTRLPAHMIPAGFVFLDHMPLTAHGKLDRPALAAIRLGGSKWRPVISWRHATPPRRSWPAYGRICLRSRKSAFSATSSIWAAIRFWRDGFWRGSQVSSVCRCRSGRLFEASTVEALARRIDEARAMQSTEPRPEIARVERDGPQPVSILQEHVLRIERELPGLPQFNLPFAYRLQGPLNVPALERSLVEVVRRHDSLRTGFSWAGERPVALIAPASDVVSPLGIEDLAAGISAGNNRAKALLLKKAELRAAQEAWTPFDMTRAPLFRTRLLRLGPDDHVLLLILHHIIVDGWSIGIFFEEVSEVYSAFAAGRHVRLPAQAFQFSDFARLAASVVH